MDFRGSLFFGLPQVVFCGSLFGVLLFCSMSVYYTHISAVNQVSFVKKLLSIVLRCIFRAQIGEHHLIDLISQLHGVGGSHFFRINYADQMQPHRGGLQTLHVVEQIRGSLHGADHNGHLCLLSDLEHTAAEGMELIFVEDTAFRESTDGNFIGFQQLDAP